MTTPGAKSSWLSVENLVRVLPIAGAILYGCLFTAYHRYYSHFGVAPEELGIGNAYVLPRAIPLVALALFSGALLAVLTASVRSFLLLITYSISRFYATRVFPALLVKHGIRRPQVQALLNLLLSTVLVVLAVLDGDMTQGLITLAVVASLYWRTRAGKVGTLLGIGLTTLILPVQSLLDIADDQAVRARAGQPVQPATFLGIPVLDVSAQPARLEWVGPPAQRPALFARGGAPVDVLLIGAASGTVVFVPDTPASATTDGRVGRLPQQFVTITTR